jgi:hypothetical protein
VNVRTQLKLGIGESFGNGMLVLHVALEKLETVVRQAFGRAAGPAGHGGPTGQQSFDGGAANSFAGAGHDGNFTGKVHLSLGKVRRNMRNVSLRPQVSGLGGFGVLRAVARVGLGLALTVGLSTCGPGHGTDCIKSTGTIITQRREVAAGLVTVTAYDNVDLRLVQDSQTYAEVRAGENLIDDIEFTRKGDALEIANTSRCNWARSYDTPREVTLHLPNVTNLFLRGQGNVSTVGPFMQDQAFLHLIGAGDFDLNFQARYLFIDQYELGDFTLRGTADELNFTVGGSGRLFAQGPTDVLDGVVAGNGTLYYAGNPPGGGVRITGAGGKKQE